jgi:predicted thioredoxin/glutaredoxin
MDENSVTIKSVATARDELLAEYKPATIKNIRKKIGRGSLSSIRAKLNQLQKLETDVQSDTKDKLRPLLQVADELLTKASEDMSGALSAQNLRLSDEIDELTEILKHGMEILEDLKAGYEYVEEAYLALVSNYDRLWDLLERKKREIEQLREELIPF